MAARIGLGVFEAGFGPAIPLYFCKTCITQYICGEAGFLTQSSKRSSTLAPKWACAWHIGLALRRLLVRSAGSSRLACSKWGTDHTSLA
jgi:hypothetical protein